MARPASYRQCVTKIKNSAGRVGVLVGAERARSRRLRQLRKPDCEMRACALCSTAALPNKTQFRFPPALQKSGVKPTAEVDPACLWAARRIQRHADLKGRDI